MSTLTLDAIVIGDRVRKDMGDLDGLAESMQRHGLLHPVVVMPDHTLVAGHRRIEAARRLGWTEIPVTIIDVEDLLGAERDENEVRKDFTPTEAVAIGRLIETRERPKAEARRLEGARRAVAVREARRRGDYGPLQIRTAIDGPTGVVDEIAAKAVGMSEPTYFRAKKVVVAAEIDPATFGDLPARMDETGSVLGAYREMKTRQGQPVLKRKLAPSAERLPINYKRPHVQPAKVIQRTLDSLDGLCIGLTVLEALPSDSPDAPRWAQAFADYARKLRAFGRRLMHEQG